MSNRRMRLTLLESSRRSTVWLFSPWQLAGVGSLAAAIGSAALLTSTPRVQSPLESDLMALFIAPPKPEGPAPSFERLSFVALEAGQGDGGLGSFQVPEPVGSVPVVAAPPAEVEVPEPPREEVVAERAFTEIEVDSVAALDPTAAGPEYPPRMLEKNIEGFVLVQFVVDSLGHADTTTFRVLDAAQPEFVAAVKAALPRMKYRPASLGGRPVSQLVQQPFGFKIKRQGTPPG